MRRLIIRPGGLGDCILALPAIEFLKAEYTEVWVPSTVAPLVQFADAVHGLSTTGIDLLGIDDVEPPPELLNRVRSFDSIVSWYGAGRPEFRDALAALGPACTFYPALPPPDKAQHAIDFFSEQVGAPSGLVPRIEVGVVPSRGSMVIHPFSGGHKKNWPLENFRKLASCLDLPVEWTAGPEEELPGAIRFENTLELARWLRGARVYIGNDSGVSHLAAALGIPVVAIFVASRAEVWGPRGDRVHILQSPTVEELLAVYRAL
jgi:heptosyltransferase-3